MAENSLIITLKDWTRKYIMLFPYIRKKEFAGMVTNPDSAIQAEVNSASALKGVGDAILSLWLYIITKSCFVIVLFLAAVIISAFASRAAGVASTYSSGELMGPIATLVLNSASALVILPFLLAIGLFIAAVIYFVVAKILGGKGSFGKTMGMLGTIAGIVFLLTIIPDILCIIPFGILIAAIPLLAVLIFALYLNFKMIQSLHGLSGIKAAAVVVISLLIITAPFILAGAVLLMLLFNFAHM
jgi:hypothetical protein